ncbi:DUF2584 family protein [Salirhabdus salicampi]|uniref:DUF2584 family protein n=1 Tax=Salirhabdus salicampi TaxID=476102 RepID=UPI0020C1DA64|nr:DUF2584 family protein [Salirhabdus salicampi]MCP8616097.1 DUF2584 domain-containing protein [Salirhabdus salicampi]
MSIPLTVEWRIITRGREQRVNQEDNTFEIVFDGYKLFPLDEPIDIMRHEDSDQIGTAKVKKLAMAEQKTVCTYQLVSLYSVN